VPRSTAKPKKRREPERDYSHRLLIDKLGVKPGQRVAVLGVESAEFLTDLASRVPEYSRGERVADADLIFFSAEALPDLARLKSLSSRSARTARSGWSIQKGKSISVKSTLSMLGNPPASPTTKSAASPTHTPPCAS